MLTHFLPTDSLTSQQGLVTLPKSFLSGEEEERKKGVTSEGWEEKGEREGRIGLSVQ